MECACAAAGACIQLVFLLELELGSRKRKLRFGSRPLSGALAFKLGICPKDIINIIRGKDENEVPPKTIYFASINSLVGNLAMARPREDCSFT
jgi:hypothetical protein